MANARAGRLADAGLGGAVPPRSAADEGGYGLVECLFTVMLVAIVAGATGPPLAGAWERSRTRAAARFIKAQMMLARAQAVARGATVALRFTGAPDAAVLATLVDGNRNGVRAVDVAAGEDRRQGPDIEFTAAFPGVRVEPVDPRGVLFSFTPVGTSSTGTFYLTGRDGSRFAVRVLGATGRARVLRHRADTDEWLDLE